MKTIADKAALSLNGKAQRAALSHQQYKYRPTSRYGFTSQQTSGVVEAVIQQRRYAGLLLTDSTQYAGDILMSTGISAPRSDLRGTPMFGREELHPGTSVLSMFRCNFVPWKIQVPELSQPQSYVQKYDYVLQVKQQKYNGQE